MDIFCSLTLEMAKRQGWGSDLSCVFFNSGILQNQKNNNDVHSHMVKPN